MAFKDGASEEEVEIQKDLELESPLANSAGLSSNDMMQAISRVRQTQRDRYGNADIRNGTLEAKDLALWCKLSDESLEWMKMNICVKSGEDSMRFYNKILKVSRTIADLEGSEEIERKHLIEAFYYNRRKII